MIVIGLNFAHGKLPLEPKAPFTPFEIGSKSAIYKPDMYMYLLYICNTYVSILI